MSVAAEPTPNPNAMKFTVGKPVGGPATFSRDSAGENPAADSLLAIEGVVSVFFTADFVTLTKSPEAAWEDITDRASSVLEDHFD